MILHRFPPLVEARLLRRYKRFLADFELPDGVKVTAHCPNPGRMTSILENCETCLLTKLAPDPKRKLNYRWELARLAHSLVTVNTQLANRVAASLLSDNEELHLKLGIGKPGKILPECSLENTCSKVRTRFDFALESEKGERLYLEVKQATLRVDDADGLQRAAFPDAVTARGTRHLEELTRLQASGIRTCLLYVVGREDVSEVRPAIEVDPKYALAFERAVDSGVTMIAVRLRVTREQLLWGSWLPVTTGIAAQA